jgi:hypothetical protein
VKSTGVEELTPLTAATAPDPYPYDARLVTERPFHRDERLGMWVAASAAAVDDVLSNPIMRVRPDDERVPASIADALMAHVFGRFVRMTDGDLHAAVKPGAGHEDRTP